MGNVVVMVSAADYQVRKDEAEASDCGLFGLWLDPVWRDDGGVSWFNFFGVLRLDVPAYDLLKKQLQKTQELPGSEGR